MRDGDILKAAFDAAGVTRYGVCAYAAVADRLLPCRAAARLPAGAASVIVAAFPYRFPEDGVPRNISRYAAVNDYHRAVGGVMERVAAALQEEMPDEQFAVFCDNSPIPEVYAAAVAGLGVCGDNGLLIDRQFGSFVFLAEIVTTRAFPPTGTAAEECLHCGRCRAACPADGAEQDRPGRCLSAITQKKGDLTEREQALVKRGGLLWGCDRCQEVCPLNESARIAPHPCFTEYIPRLAEEDLAADLHEKPYGWRGAAPLVRNFEILKRMDKKI